MITGVDSEEFIKSLGVINGLTLGPSFSCNDDWLDGPGFFTQGLRLGSLLFFFSGGGLASIFSSSFDFVCQNEN